MRRKSERTMETYMKAGAEMRLFKSLGTKLAVDISSILSASDQVKLLRALKKIDEVCSEAENNMFRDHPELPDSYTDVFYGNIDGKPRNDVDEKVISIAREVADELFERT